MCVGLRPPHARSVLSWLLVHRRSPPQQERVGAARAQGCTAAAGCCGWCAPSFSTSRRSPQLAGEGVGHRRAARERGVVASLQAQRCAAARMGCLVLPAVFNARNVQYTPTCKCLRLRVPFLQTDLPSLCSRVALGCLPN